MTYSLVARDAETGELGVAVQSRSFGTGRVVPWAAAGVGAVATQSFSLASYGPFGLTAMRAGAAPGEALAELVAADALRDFRQVAFVDARGRTASHTGTACIPAAGARAGKGFSAQGNMLRSDEVWQAAAEGFEAASGSLAERLLEGLDAAEAAGGDSRGQGTAVRQEFPADAASIALFTAQGRSVSNTNVWALELTPDVFVYELARPGGRLFRVAFDLRQPVTPPPAPCGAGPQAD